MAPKEIYTIDCEDAVAFIWEAVWGFAEFDPNGVCVWANPAYCLVLGAPHELVLGTAYSEWTHEEDISIERDLSDKVRSGIIPGFTLRKRYIQRGSTPQRPLIVWGLLSVTGKWKADTFAGFRVQFKPFEEQQENLLEFLKKIPTWIVENQKIVWTVLILSSTLLFGSSNRFVQLLQQVKDSEQSIEQSLQDSPSPALPSPE